MAVAYVDRGAFAGTSLAPTAALPTSWSEGDLLIVTWAGRYDDDHSTGPSGWTKIGETTTGGTDINADCKVSVWYKVAGASESDVTWIDGGNCNLVVMTSWSGVDTTSPIDNYTTNNTSGSTTTSHTAPSITPNSADCGLFVSNCFGDDTARPVSSQSRTPIGDNSTTSGRDTALDLQYSILSGSGASGTTSVTSNAAVTGAYISVTLKPAGAGGGFQAAWARGSNTLIQLGEG